MPLVLPTSLAVHRFSADSPSIVFCLTRSGSVSLMCRRAGLSLSASGRTLERPLGFWLHQAFQNLSVHFHVGAVVQVIFRCLRNPLFHRTPSDSLLPGLLPSSFTCRGRRMLSPWCIPFSFVIVPSRPTGHQEFKPSSLKVSNVSHTLSSLASFRIRLKPTSTSSGPSRSSRCDFLPNTVSFLQ